MCGIARFYCFKSGIHWIEDVPRENALKTRRRLRSEEVTVYHSVIL